MRHCGGGSSIVRIAIAPSTESESPEMDSQALDAPIMKEVGEAVRALYTLHKTIGGLVSQVPPSVPPDKAKALWIKVRKYMERYAPVTKINGSKVFDQLSPATQEGLRWLDETMAELLKLEDALRMAAKTADLDFAKDPAKAIKQIKAANAEAGKPSWATGTISRIEKDIKTFEGQKSKTDSLADFLDGAKDIGGVEGSALTSLGLVILFYHIWKYLTGRKTSAPK